jgi:type II secretory pathway predicted ATPase ExeA
MILDYYNLAEQPFGVTPDPRYLYLSATHREALASVLYGVTGGRGFTALIAKPGMGKTTLLFDLLGKVRNSARTVFLFQSQYSPRDLLRSLLADLGVEDDGNDLVRMHRKLNETLLTESSRGKRLIVVIDEAQNLEEPVLEVVRMLSNFETPREKLMHLVLAGQPQLAQKLATPRMVQLRQRISIIARLKPFNAEETQLYIDHRLRVAGYDFAKPLFTKQAQAVIASHAGGIPRNISNICFNAMSLGCAMKQKTIDVKVIQEVLDDLDLRPLVEDSVSASKLETPNPPVRVSSNVPTASVLGNWPLRVALSLSLVAALSWPFIRNNKYVEDVLASAPSSAAQDQANTPLPAESRPGDPRFVIVLPDETLYHISMRTLGKYDDQARAKFRELNPWLVDPDHIEAGQKIWVPSLNDVSRTIHRVAEQVPDALGSGAEKP